MQIITHTAAAHGCTADVDWLEEAHPYYPPTVNDPTLTAFAQDVGSRLALQTHVHGSLLYTRIRFLPACTARFTLNCNTVVLCKTETIL